MEMVPNTHDNGMQKGAGSFWGASSGASACHPQGQEPSRPIQQLGSVNGSSVCFQNDGFALHEENLVQVSPQ